MTVATPSRASTPAKHARRAFPVRQPSVIVIGCGMSGILMGIRLREAGITDFQILEKADALGGTWRDNHYPGLACDVPAYLYTYSFEPNPECSHRYARGPEIRRYFETAFARHGLAAHTRFGTEVVSARFHDHGWTVVTSDGRERRADFVVAATGILHHPNLPQIPGLERFKGATMHSARWDHRVATQGKRVGIIGTGSTAVQIVSALVSDVSELKLFQRTPQWVIPGLDTAYRNWRKPLLRRFPALAGLAHRGYAHLFTPLGLVGVDPRMHRAIDLIAKLNLWLSVRDPALRERLTPDYRPGCKRLIMSDRFYAAIQQPNAELVSEGITAIEPEGVRTADGRLHALDVLVLATGFKALAYLLPIEVTGAQGRPLSEAWSEGAKAYRTVALPEFPNFFMLQGPHSPVGNFSLIESSERQVSYVMQLIELFRAGRFRSVAPRAEATDAYNQSLREAAGKTIWASGCQSWYLDRNGLPAIWPWSARRFHEELEQVRLDDFALHT